MAAEGILPCCGCCGCSGNTPTFWYSCMHGPSLVRETHLSVASLLQLVLCLNCTYCLSIHCSWSEVQTHFTLAGGRLAPCTWNNTQQSMQHVHCMQLTSTNWQATKLYISKSSRRSAMVGNDCCNHSSVQLQVLGAVVNIVIFWSLAMWIARTPMHVITAKLTVPHTV